MAEIKITKDNFEQEVLKSDKPVLIDFWATWCGPCKMIAPVIEEIAADYGDKIKVGKVNVDEEPELSVAFQVTGIPMIVLMKDGQVADSLVGFRSKAEIEAMLK